MKQAIHRGEVRDRRRQPNPHDSTLVQDERGQVAVVDHHEVPTTSLLCEEGEHAGDGHLGHIPPQAFRHVATPRSQEKTPHPRLQLHRVDRFRQVVVDPELVAEETLFLSAKPREEYDRNVSKVGSCPKHPNELHAVHSGHFDVGEHEIRWVGQCFAESVEAIFRELHAPHEATNGGRSVIARRVVVVDHQHGCVGDRTGALPGDIVRVQSVQEQRFDDRRGDIGEVESHPPLVATLAGLQVGDLGCTRNYWTGLRFVGQLERDFNRCADGKEVLG